MFKRYLSQPPISSQYNSAGIYIRDERLRKATYSFSDYMETVVGHGAQDRSEKALLEKGQHPYQHTRKQAVSMAAKQMVSNNPTLRKVSLRAGPIFIVARVRATGRYILTKVLSKVRHILVACIKVGDWPAVTSIGIWLLTIFLIT